jgi:hypothetical protein
MIESPRGMWWDRLAALWRRRPSSVTEVRVSTAYPYARADDFDARSIDAVRKAGFETACSSIPGNVDPDTDSLELSRAIVMGRGRSRFRAQMLRWGGVVTR